MEFLKSAYIAMIMTNLTSGLLMQLGPPKVKTLVKQINFQN